MPYSFRRSSLQRMAKLVDLLMVGFAVVIALIISSESFTWRNLTSVFAARIKVMNLLILLGYLGLCSVVFTIHGFYRSHRSLNLTQRLARILLGTTFIAVILLVLRAPFQFSFATDRFLAIFWLLDCWILVISHETARILQYFARLHGRKLRNVIVIGEGQSAENLVAHIDQQPTPGYRVLRIITAKEDEV